jgi:signal transduction histidine kinase/CheY-like chemotaxis protein
LTGESVSYEGDYVRENGSRIYFNAAYIPHKDHQGNILGFYALITDISKYKLSQQQLLEAKELAEQASDAKSTFLSRMSHELRTPLNSIVGFAQLLETDTQLDESQQSMLHYILTSGRHLLDLINDLLDLARIESKKLEVAMIRIDLAERIKDSIKVIEPLAKQRGISLEVQWQNCHSTYVQADPVRIKQVLLNLLSNAVKYNRQNGSICIDCQPTDADMCRISVSDSGSGIPPQDMEQLFAPFSRLYLKTYAVEGAGIGLALSKQLVELMDGRIGVESEYGQGSTFWFELRLSQLPKKADFEGEQIVTEPPLDKSYTLLYVEDSPSHIQLMENIYAKEPDISLIYAHTPTLGLELAQVHKPDLIILDICLPGMDGYQVLEQLKKDKVTRYIPVVALSASAMPHEVERALRFGFRRYFTKPVDIIQFKRAIRELLLDAQSCVNSDQMHSDSKN